MNVIKCKFDERISNAIQHIRSHLLLHNVGAMHVCTSVCIYINDLKYSFFHLIHYLFSKHAHPHHMYPSKNLLVIGFFISFVWTLFW